MAWYWWIFGLVVGFVVLLEIEFRKRMKRVALVEDRHGYPSVVPWYSPMLATGKLLVMAATGKIKYLLTTNFFQRFQTLKSPCMTMQTVNFMGMHMFITCKPEMIRHILFERQKYVKMNRVSHDADRLVSQGVFSSEGEEWHRQRSILSPSFKYKKLKSLVPLFCETTAKLIDQIEKQGYTTEKKSFDVQDWLTRTTLDGIGKAGFGYNFNAVEHGSESLVHTYNNVMKGLTNLGRVLPWYRILPLKSNFDVEKAITTFEGIIDKIIAEKRKLIATESFDNSTADLLSLLLHAGSDLTDLQLRHNVITFFIAGHETTASCLAFTLCMLQQHPEVQKKQQKEIDEVLGGNLPTQELLKKLPYMSCVIKEVLRLYPPAVAITRVVGEDDVIDGYQVTKGMHVFIPIYVLHRLQEYWGPDALEFNPDRWAEGKPKPINGSYIPFGSGARQCIGNNFAQLEIKVVLAMLVQRYNFVADPTCKVPFDCETFVSLMLAKGHTLCLEKRKMHV